MNCSRLCRTGRSLLCRRSTSRLYCNEPPTKPPAKPRPDVSQLLREASSFELSSTDDRWASDTYPIDKELREQLKAEHSDESRLRVDPRTTSVIIFPGQGAQYPGMAGNLVSVPGVRDMFDYASSVMKIDILKLCLSGPSQLLDMTINCQMAMLVTSLAVLEKLKLSHPEVIETCVATAGFSVGEYAALVFAGALSFEEAVQVVKIRGEAMQLCSENRPSGMMTVFLSPASNLNYGMKLAREWCFERENIKDPVCEVANYLYPHCKTIGGDEKALDFLQRNAREFNLRRSKRLAVSGAFHTRLMKPAKKVLEKALSEVDIRHPGITVISNVDAAPYTEPHVIRKKLVEHIYMPVEWEQSMHRLYQREQGNLFPNTYEVGPGDTLRPILKMVNAKAHSQSFKADL